MFHPVKVGRATAAAPCLQSTITQAVAAFGIAQLRAAGATASYDTAARLLLLTAEGTQRRKHKPFAPSVEVAVHALFISTNVG